MLKTETTQAQIWSGSRSTETHHRDCAGPSIYCNCHILFGVGAARNDGTDLDEAYAMYYDPDYSS